MNIVFLEFLSQTSKGLEQKNVEKKPHDKEIMKKESSAHIN